MWTQHAVVVAEGDTHAGARAAVPGISGAGEPASTTPPQRRCHHLLQWHPSPHHGLGTAALGRNGNLSGLHTLAGSRGALPLGGSSRSAAARALASRALGGEVALGGTGTALAGARR